MEISKITLGTAQLGLNYGIANVNGKPSFDQTMRILQFSLEGGINTLDTSPQYGNIEELVGIFFSSNIGKNFDNIIIVSKFPAIDLKIELSFNNIYTLIKEKVSQSMRDLKINHIPIYLIHHAPDIYLKDGIIIKCLNQLKEEGLIGKIGISVYNTDEVDTSLNYKEIDVIQIPINIFDHRIINLGLLKRLRKKNYIIFARSIYLQGLFFLTPNNLPSYLKIAEKPLKKLKNLSDEFNIEIAKLAFLFIRDLPEITSMVIGAENIEQIRYNLKMLEEKPLIKELRTRIIEEFSDISENIINPSLWNK